MPRITEVVKHLIIINVLMYLGTIVLMGEPSDSLDLINNPDGSRFMEWGRNILAVYFPTSEYFQPYQLVSHMFMHGSPMHLIFNMYGLYLFGTAIEATWGAKRFFFYYFFTGFGALALHMFVQYIEVTYGGISPYAYNVPMLGASGAVFGLLAGFGMLYPNQVISLLFPPISLKAKYFVAIYGGLELFLGLGGFQAGVAHFAHVGGAVFGILLILYWRKFGTNL
jgi:membrane associated rhomboid family serine protease